MDQAKTPENNNKTTNTKSNSAIAGILDYAEIFVISVCAVLILFSFVFRLCKVVGPSMEQTLYQDEMLIVSDVGYEPQREDIIVFHQTGYLNEPIVKRVIATEGETVDIDFDTWTVTVTDTEGNTFILEEDYMHLDSKNAILKSNQSYPYTVEKGKVFVMGDNRNHSTDSRSTIIGTVDERRILGKLILRVTPFDKFGKVE